MKKYYDLGELLIDYRQINKSTQLDLATELEVDVRTISRWEKNTSLIKPNKVEDVVDVTFIPYQVIHNLNAAVPKPIYYDFLIRKFSLTSVEQELPFAEWFKTRMDITSRRINPINKADNIENIAKYHRHLYNTDKPVRKSIIKAAADTFPELNLMLYDEAGFYAGHSSVFPISLETFNKLKNKEIVEGDLTINNMTNYQKSNPMVLYAYSVYADSNENAYYIMGAILRFMKKIDLEEYIFSGLAIWDGGKLVKELGLNIIWQDFEEQEKLNLHYPPTFFEGQFHDFLIGH